jgi:hypothetical protein
MAFRFPRIYGRRKKPQLRFTRSSRKKTINIVLEKRQKFILSVMLLSIALFFTESQFRQSGFLIAFLLSFFTDVFLFWAIRNDLKDAESEYPYSIFILPFFYTLAFVLFYFLVPSRLLSRVILTILYGVGLYSLYLCQNIFTVSSIRTIALVSGAKIVSFVLTLLSFFFLSNIIFTLHLPIYFSVPLVGVFSGFLVFQSLWTYAPTKPSLSLFLWSGVLTVCLLEIAATLWFWPSSPTVIALFMTGFFYTIVGLSHVWLERRLFRGVLWEYVWVGAVVFFVLQLFTSWGV